MYIFNFVLRKWEAPSNHLWTPNPTEISWVAAHSPDGLMWLETDLLRHQTTIWLFLLASGTPHYLTADKQPGDPCIWYPSRLPSTPTRILILSAFRGQGDFAKNVTSFCATCVFLRALWPTDTSPLRERLCGLQQWRNYWRSAWTGNVIWVLGLGLRHQIQLISM